MLCDVELFILPVDKIAKSFPLNISLSFRLGKTDFPNEKSGLKKPSIDYYSFPLIFSLIDHFQFFGKRISIKQKL